MGDLRSQPGPADTRRSDLLARRVAEIVDTAPPLTGDQQRKLAALLAPRPEGVRDGR